eukprot:Seg784.8 transcript_id=Seg784.8/GoldUCD/mRNA.D3Y31 product="Gamma-aminobutyric acid receptor subunit beta" protein_id=Seg784.8/GoldUCD/D3Y31
MWTDYRVNMPIKKGEWLAFGSEFLSDIWVPEVHFPSAKKGQWYKLMKPNTAVHVHPDGKIVLSRRLSLTVFCPMDLHNFPFDEQTCTLPTRFYAYNNDHCRLKWSFEKGGPIFTPKKLAISEFTLQNYLFDESVTVLSTAGAYDTLSVKFILRRNIGFYVFQYLLPCALIVILSWVGFWIDYQSTPARASLGITTVLTITTLSNSIRSSLPQVAYVKSLDVYLLSCFVFVFASTAEFALTGITARKWRKAYEMKQEAQKKRRIEGKIAKRDNFPEDIHLHRIESDHPTEISDEVDRMTDTLETMITESDVTFPKSSAELAVNDNLDILSTRHSQATSDSGENGELSKDSEEAMTAESDRGITTRLSKYLQKVVEKNIESNNATHLIDKLARYIFPISFASFNALYFAFVFLVHEDRVM